MRVHLAGGIHLDAFGRRIAHRFRPPLPVTSVRFRGPYPTMKARLMQD